LLPNASAITHHRIEIIWTSQLLFYHFPSKKRIIIVDNPVAHLRSCSLETATG
jgi:hypothetical protein